MQWIKVLLVLAAVVFLILLFRHRQRVELRAGFRVTAIILTILAIASIIEPDIPQRAAELVGVTRGTDLLLYILVVVFALTSMGFYFRLREADQRMRRLARAMAIERALREHPPVGEGPRSQRPV